MAQMRVLRARNVNAFSNAVQKILNAKTETDAIVLRGVVKKLKTFRNFSYFDLTEGGQFIRCYCRGGVLENIGQTLEKDMFVEVSGDLQVYDRQSLIQIDVQHIHLVDKNSEIPTGMRLVSPLQMNQYIAELIAAIAQDHQFVLSGTVSGFRSMAKYDYFDLGDEKHAIRCILWHEARSRSDTLPQNGAQLKVLGDLQVYETKAMLQLNVKMIQSADPDVTIQYQDVIRQLTQRGLWPKRNPHPLPRTVKKIGFITSKRSKSRDDFHKTYTDMGGQAEILDSFAWVEGKNAASQIATAINRFSQNKAVDVIVVTRGGGAQDKLSEVFDSYLVAEAICQSRVPVITAIGHTSDETFADVIADDTMDTPTRAAVELARIKAKRGFFG